MSNDQFFINSSTLEKDLSDQQLNQAASTKDVLYLIIRYTLFISSSLSDVLIIVAYFKVHLLRKSHNKLILNWAFVNLYYFLHHLIIVDLICYSILKLTTTPVFLLALSSSVLMLIYVFGLGMLLQFTLDNINHGLSLLLVDSIKYYLLAFIYSLGISIYIYEFFYYKYFIYDIAVIGFNSIIFIALIFDLILLSHKTNLNFNCFYVVYVANVIIGSIVPMVLYHYLFLAFLDRSSFVLDLIFLSRLLPQIVMFSNSMIVCIILYKTSRDFNMGFRACFRAVYSGVELRNNWVFIEECST